MKGMIIDMATRENVFELTTCDRALQLLKEGNSRYVSGKVLTPNFDVKDQLAEKGQAPFAIILGCSDSRVPPEIIFDVGIGQIFTVRTAGHIANAVTIGSMEYAVEHLKARLIVVLGHDKCGAVAASISGGDFGPNIGALISDIKPAVDVVRAKEPGSDDILSECEDEHVRQTAAKLSESAIFKKYIDDKTLKIVGAKYELKSGKVVFFDK